MPVKKTEKYDSKKKENQEKQWSKKILKDIESGTKRKVVVKRRKSDLKPTRASAVAIVSQANRAKKQALIEKISSKELPPKKIESSSDTKIPLRVWTLFWCSLLLFCVSFYQAYIRPQLEDSFSVDSKVFESVDKNHYAEERVQYSEDYNDNEANYLGNDGLDNGSETIEDAWIYVPTTAIEVIEEFFRRLSNNHFDDAFSLFTPSLQRSSEIRQHFTSFRMAPFIDWIEWWRLEPTNFEYKSTSSYWKDRYSFDLTYVLKSNQERYEETREFVIDSTGNEPKIWSVVCVSKKCSYHPIFWPENFGMVE